MAAAPNWSANPKSRKVYNALIEVTGQRRNRVYLAPEIIEVLEKD